MGSGDAGILWTDARGRAEVELAREPDTDLKRPHAILVGRASGEADPRKRRAVAYDACVERVAGTAPFRGDSLPAHRIRGHAAGSQLPMPAGCR